MSAYPQCYRTSPSRRPRDLAKFPVVSAFRDCQTRFCVLNAIPCLDSVPSTRDTMLPSCVMAHLLRLAVLVCWLQRAALADDSAFNHTLLATFQTASSPYLTNTAQLTFDAVLGRLYIADAGNSRLVSFFANATNGTAPSATADILGAGSPTSSPLDSPLGVAFAPDQSIWATDTRRGGLVQFNASSGAVLQSFAGQQTQLTNSQNIAVDAQGALYVSDWLRAVVRKVARLHHPQHG